MKANDTTKMMSKYDYSRFIKAAKAESQYTSFSTFIDEMIRRRRSQEYDGETRRFNRTVLAQEIGIDSSTLTKIINGSQATRKRDLVIALCCVLKLNEDEIHQALSLYSMAPLNPYNMRDLVIINALQDKVSLNKLNEIIADHGFPCLDVKRNNGKIKEDSFYYPLNASAYEIVSTEIFPYCIAGKDSDIDLSCRYQPDRFSFDSHMIIQSKDEAGVKYKIALSDDEHYCISFLDGDEWKFLYSNLSWLFTYGEKLPPCKDSSLLNEVEKLRELIRKKANYIYEMCDDTRNFGTRMSAENRNGELIVYGETFNYDEPEYCEYYQIYIESGEISYSISSSSRFMHRYLREDKWKKLYGYTPSPVKQSFSSLESITNPVIKKQFRKLMDSAKELLIKLQKRELFICNALAWIDIDELMHMFMVEELFECIKPDEPPLEIVPQKDQILGSDGLPITVDDLWRAAELGISTLDDLCATRVRYGSLEQFLQLDSLNKIERCIS